ncbi:MAG: B12-binding domain-containing radical SAM protein [Anaerolineae bacterium]
MHQTILMYNPISTSPGKQRLPMSLLAIASMLRDDYDFELCDGNLIADPATHLIARAQATDARLLAMSVMPGPQLQQAVSVVRAIKYALPDLTIIWGGYFPSHHYELCLKSGYVDYVIVGQGEVAFRRFVDCFYESGTMRDVPSLAYYEGDELVITPKAPIAPLENLPRYPYHKIEMEPYVGKSYLGERVLSHHSSWGCPFACNFCAVVPLARQRWSAESAERVGETMRYLKGQYQIDGMEFHDMDFFVKEDRSVMIAEQMMDLQLNWWGLGRVDTLMGYDDSSYQALADSGLKMVFMGAEAGDDETLKLMNKGGRSGVDQTLAIVERMARFDIVPELSFVLGTPPDPVASIESTIQFIRHVKAINPATEIILYMYTPVANFESTLMQEAIAQGFQFPQTLEEWASDEWAEKALRRSPGTPWSDDPIRRKIRDFETVINAFYPTVTDQRLHGAMRTLLKTVSGWRYQLEFYSAPYELKLLQRLIHYRRPETTGF